MGSLIVWAIVAIGLLGSIITIVHMERKAGGDEVRAELQPKLTACTQALDIVRTEGEKAKEAARVKEMADKLAKDTADAENLKTKKDLDSLYAAYRSLRDQRARSGSGLLPAPPSGSASPATASFDRSALDNALSGFDKGVTGLIREGDQAIADLNTARTWAQKR